MVAPEISLGGNFSLDEKGEFYSTTTLYGYIKKADVEESYYTLLAILNSNLFWWYLRKTGTVLANNYFRFKPAYINPFPIPKISKSSDEWLTKTVQDLIKAKENNNLDEQHLLTGLIDDYIYDLFQLSELDIIVVKSS